MSLNFSRRLDEVRNWIGLLSLLFNRRHANAARLYSLMSTENVLSNKTLFINLGYWENTREYDEACYALARLLADTAELNQSDTVLDAGFGFAEQDIFWAKMFYPAMIIGLNVSGLQVAIATRRVRDAGFGDRIRLINGSASDMPIADGSVMKVLALESAFHFFTRQRFFEEAFASSSREAVLRLPTCCFYRRDKAYAGPRIGCLTILGGRPGKYHRPISTQSTAMRRNFAGRGSPMFKFGQYASRYWCRSDPTCEIGSVSRIRLIK
jgi:hypothetical protein